MVQVVSKPEASITGRYVMHGLLASATAGATDILYPDPLGNGTPPAGTRLAHGTSTNSCFDVSRNPAGASAVIRTIIYTRDSGTNAAEGSLVIKDHAGTNIYLEVVMTNANTIFMGNLAIPVPTGFRVDRTCGTTKKVSYVIEYDVVGA